MEVQSIGQNTGLSYLLDTELSSLESLPMEIILKIFEDLDQKSKASASAVSKTLRATVLESEDFVLNPEHTKTQDFSQIADQPLDKENLHPKIKEFLKKLSYSDKCIGIALSDDRVFIVITRSSSYGSAEFLETIVSVFSKAEGLLLKRKKLARNKSSICGISLYFSLNSTPTHVAYDKASDSLAIAFSGDSGRVFNSELKLKYTFDQPCDQDSLYKIVKDKFQVYHPVDVFKIDQNKIISGLRNGRILIWNLNNGKLQSTIDRNLKPQASSANKSYRSQTWCHINSSRYYDTDRYYNQNLMIIIKNVDTYATRTINDITIKGHFAVVSRLNDPMKQLEVWDLRTGNFVHDFSYN